MRDLIGRMSIDDKFWQLFMIPGSLDDPAHDYSHGAFGLQIRDAKTARGIQAESAGEAGKVQ